MTHNLTDRSQPTAQPVNTEAATRLVDEVLALQLDTTTRAEMHARTGRLTDEITRLTRSSRAGVDMEGRSLRAEADDLVRRAPDHQAIVFSTFTYMRSLALFLRRYVAYAQEVTSQPEDGAIAPRADPEPRPPSGLATIDQRSWLAGVAG
ncbi:hypothetical protein KQH42_27800 [Streptomyces sp. CHA1]|uniref:hypothetical protein n=1 Tax=Streptomyces TaxID=1883 RepID=UPI001BFC08FF|nr:MULTISPECIES: hypothetical protein [unclassified Streptomyces]MBT3160586.1 hypothetical protein [Streptomyces sp. G11C]MCO6704234.1 hypothetical protein [Streptomyces sp. CHB9.2]MCO6710508.1 hypothetical protein [Streptomyces sp. CHA3]MCO6716303.1 hypothetical protein [Streptomyces sp. CHB19.2]MCO6722433.1 hypothetical protein [Streptomyces sp. Vc714c-19]